MNIKNTFIDFVETYLDEVCQNYLFTREYERINWEADIVDYFIQDESSEDFEVKEIEEMRNDLENIALRYIEDYKSIVEETPGMR